MKHIVSTEYAELGLGVPGEIHAFHYLSFRGNQEFFSLFSQTLFNAKSRKRPCSSSDTNRLHPYP